MRVTEELRQLVALSLIEGLGPRSFRLLLEKHKSLSAIFRLAGSDSKNSKKLRGVQVNREAFKDPDLFRKADAEIEKALKQNVSILSCLDAEYPEALKMIYDPPIVLYVKGQWPEMGRPRVAVVGSRACSLYGRKMAHGISKELAQNRVVVVSGLALGIDSAAHEGALDGGGPTVAVLGSGLGRLYPPSNEKLAARIMENGAVISEYPMDMEPLPKNFPSRNRIISGLARGVVVVEAHRKSGSLITAALALEEGREVFAVPANADSRRSEGSHWLLKQGARLVTSAEDILEELKLPSRKSGAVPAAGSRPPVGAEERQLLSLMDGEARHVDELIEASGLPASRVIASLSLLEIKGLVRQIPGKNFIAL